MTLIFARMASRIGPVLLACGVTTTSVLAQPAPVFCNGTGRLFTSDVAGRSGGVYAVIPGSAGDDAVTVEVLECGRAIRVWVPAEARTIHLVQSATHDLQYTDTIEIQGENATFSMFKSDARTLRGTFEVNALEADLYADVTLEVTDAHAPNMDGCEDDPEPEFVPRGISMSHAALADALTATGRTLPANANFSDYISAESNSPSGMEAVYVRLGANGDILPAKVPALSIADICFGRSGTAEPPLEVLRFKVFTFERTTTVFVQRVEIETGKIVEQHEGAATGEGASSVKRAILMAMGELSKKPGSFVGIDR
jgi:hypothetical protein